MIAQPRPGRPRAAFTLIELMVSTVLAMILLGLSITAFYNFRKMVARSEARLAMHASAQTTYTYLQRTLASVQQSCAFVATRVQGNAALTPDPGEIRLLFMRAKEQISSYREVANEDKYIRNDLTWELWVWKRGDRTLSIANNSNGDTSVPGRNFVSGAFTPAGVNFNGKRFYTTPQPRRTLDAANPFTAAAGGLDDNILFPGVSGTSMANAAFDVGDYTDLTRNLSVVLDNVSDLAFDIVTMDGTSYLINDASAAAPVVLNGVWLDGRLGPALTSIPAYATSDAAKRPRLLRMRLTLADPRYRRESVPLTAAFSFSFALPGLSGDQ